MLDQEARPEAGALPEPTPDSRSSRGRRGALFAVLAGLAAVVLAAAGFAVGRATDDGGSSTAVTTRPAPADKSKPAASKTSDTVPTLAFGEAVESQPDKPLDNATRDKLAADLVAARTAAMKYP